MKRENKCGVSVFLFVFFSSPPPHRYGLLGMGPDAGRNDAPRDECTIAATAATASTGPSARTVSFCGSIAVYNLAAGREQDVDCWFSGLGCGRCCPSCTRRTSW